MTQQEEKQVTITSEDISNIKTFFEHFQIPLPDYLSNELGVFEQKGSSYTYDDQLKLKNEMAHALVECFPNHEILKDELFEPVIKNCEKAWYEEQFNRDIEKHLAVDNEEGENSES